MLTKNDFKKLEEKFATKEDLKTHETKYKEIVVSFKDEILHEIKAMREELTIITGYKDQIEDHEARIETIEKRLQIPTTV